MTLLSDLLSASKYPPREYDGLTVSEVHYAGMVKEAAPSAPLPLTYAGIAIVASNLVPPGFAVMTLEGTPVGVINLDRGTAALVPVKPEHPIFEASDFRS